MKVLMVNKFLHPNGGSETYIFRLGEYLAAQGHEVQYFGMEHDVQVHYLCIPQLPRSLGTELKQASFGLPT